MRALDKSVRPPKSRHGATGGRDGAEGAGRHFGTIDSVMFDPDTARSRPARRPAVACAVAVMATFAGPAAALDLPPWSVEHLREHPLVGSVWTGAGHRVDPAALKTAAIAADFVAIGEIHVNPDHHRIQAAVIEAMAAAGRRPAIVLEMVPERLDPALQRLMAEATGDAADFGAALEWEARGWPDWAIYRPIAEVALRHRLPMRAGDLDRGMLRALGKGESGALDGDRAARYGLDQPLPAAIEQALRRDLARGHCGLVPDRALGPMLQVQRARDGALADAMIAADTGSGSVLIAGSGHVRRDRGAPRVLASRAPSKTIVAIGLLEVSAGAAEFADYGAASDGPRDFDFIIFTPRSETGDPCAGLKERFGKPDGGKP